LVTIAKETGQAAAIVSSINIEKMIAALWGSIVQQSELGPDL
jgi:hypothetical protein